MGGGDDNPYESPSGPQLPLASSVAASDSPRQPPGVEPVATWKIYINVIGVVASVVVTVAIGVASVLLSWRMPMPLAILLIPAALWLLVGWGVALYQVLWAYVWWRQGNRQWYHHLIAAGLALACYVVWVASALYEYIVD